MSLILEALADSSDGDDDSTSVRHAEDLFMGLHDNVGGPDPQDDSASTSEEPSPSESSDSSYLNIGLGDDTDDEETDTGSIDVDEQQPSQDLEEVSTDVAPAIPELHSYMICL